MFKLTSTADYETYKDAYYCIDFTNLRVSGSFYNRGYFDGIAKMINKNSYLVQSHFFELPGYLGTYVSDFQLKNDVLDTVVSKYQTVQGRDGTFGEISDSKGVLVDKWTEADWNNKCMSGFDYFKDSDKVNINFNNGVDYLVSTSATHIDASYGAKYTGDQCKGKTLQNGQAMACPFELKGYITASKFSPTLMGGIFMAQYKEFGTNFTGLALISFSKNAKSEVYMSTLKCNDAVDYCERWGTSVVGSQGASITLAIAKGFYPPPPPVKCDDCPTCKSA